MSTAIEKVTKLFPYMKTVQVKFNGTAHEYFYTLKCRINLKVGDLVVVPTKDTFSLARVTHISDTVTKLYRGIYCRVDAEWFQNYEVRSSDTLMTLASWAKADSEWPSDIHDSQTAHLSSCF